MTPNAARKEFLRELGNMSYRRSQRDIFVDFAMMAAAALHNRLAHDEELEQEYLTTINRYEPADRAMFPRLLALTVEMMGETPKDVLGPLYMEIDAGNAAAGQFFTPPDLSELMARMIGPAPDEEPDFKTISDPACGAGSMLLAAAAAVLARGQNPRRKMFAEGIDIDRTCAFMCFVQLSLWGIPAIVWHGNALTGKFQKGWATPIYYLDGWHPIMRARRLLASIHLSEQPEKAAAACKGPTKPEPKSLIDLMIAP